MNVKNRIEDEEFARSTKTSNETSSSSAWDDDNDDAVDYEDSLYDEDEGHDGKYCNSIRRNDNSKETIPPPPLNSLPHRPEPDAGLSLDFQRVINYYSIQAILDCSPPTPLSHALSIDDETPLLASSRKHSFRKVASSGLLHDQDGRIGYAGRSGTRWILTIAVGLCMGLVAITIVKLTEWLFEWKRSQLEAIWVNYRHDNNTLLLFYMCFNLFLALVSAALTIGICPQAAGSGIPEVKAYLNGVRIYKFGRWRLFAVTVFATLLSVSSGLVCGPEGPFIHIGAILGLGVTKAPSIAKPIFATARSCSRCRETLWSWFNFDLAYFHSDAERRDLVSIGAAVGFAACFGAPIGGLLFALEEASSFFQHPLLLRTLAATAVATFCMAIHNGSLSHYSVISLETYSVSTHETFLSRFQEVPLYIINATAGGAVGALFVVSWKAVQLKRSVLYAKVTPRARSGVQLAEVAILSLLTSFATFYLSTREWACRRSETFRDDLARDIWTVPGVLCEKGRLNKAAGILFGGRDAPIRVILLHPEQFDSRTLLSVGLLFLFLMVLTLGVSLPSGVFMPTFLIGSSLGGFMGVQYNELLSDKISPSTFALLGSAALLAGIQRSTVSLCVIIVEGTGQVRILIPVIITVVVARYVGDWIIKTGLYDVAIELRQYPYLHHEENKLHDIFQVSSIMSMPPTCLGPRENAMKIARLLDTCTHNGFPVVGKNGKLLGLVRRDQLVALLECGVFMSDEEFDDLESGQYPYTTNNCEWSPKPGSSRSPLMNLAYHIKDDRYENLSERRRSSRSCRLQKIASETVTWSDNVLQTVKKLDMESLPIEISEQIKRGAHCPSSRATRYARVQRTPTGQVGVGLNPACMMEQVYVAAVMNRGVHTVTEFCPVSSAKSMFTTLGLRHLVVLGGETGGDVVGVLTRSSFLTRHIDQTCSQSCKLPTTQGKKYTATC